MFSGSVVSLMGLLWLAYAIPPIGSDNYPRVWLIFINGSVDPVRSASFLFAIVSVISSSIFPPWVGFVIYSPGLFASGRSDVYRLVIFSVALSTLWIALALPSLGSKEVPSAMVEFRKCIVVSVFSVLSYGLFFG